MKKHRLSHEQDLCAGEPLSHFDGYKVEAEKQFEEKEELLQQETAHIKIHDLSETDVYFLNAYHDPKYQKAIDGLLKGVESPLE